ncbi:MAG TPA: hypothetical protein VGL81_30910 [Polyangiaceae bacterium]|jgi:hypothetical protein
MVFHDEPLTPIDAAIRVTPDVRAAFDRDWRQCCSCVEVDVLERHGRLRCARCDAPILRRHRT